MSGVTPPLPRCLHGVCRDTSFIPERRGAAAKSIRFGKSYVPNWKPSEGKHLSIKEIKETRSKPDDGSLRTNSGKNVVL
jgi:hypothetical protein